MRPTRSIVGQGHQHQQVMATANGGRRGLAVPPRPSRHRRPVFEASRQLKTEHRERWSGFALDTRESWGKATLVASGRHGSIRRRWAPSSAAPRSPARSAPGWRSAPSPSRQGRPSPRASSSSHLSGYSPSCSRRFGALVFGARWSAARARPVRGAARAGAAVAVRRARCAGCSGRACRSRCCSLGSPWRSSCAEPVDWPGRLRGAGHGRLRTAPWWRARSRCVVFAVAWRGTANLDPGRRRAALPGHHPEPAAGFRPAIDDNHQRRDYLEYPRRRDEAGLPEARKGRARLFDPRAWLVRADRAGLRLGGYRASAMFLLAHLRLGTGLVWRLAWRTTGDPGAAWFGWSVVDALDPDRCPRLHHLPGRRVVGAAAVRACGDSSLHASPPRPGACARRSGGGRVAVAAHTKRGRLRAWSGQR